MEDLLRLILNCFSIASLVIVASLCTKKSSDTRQVAQNEKNVLTMSTSSISIEDVEEKEQKEVENVKEDVIPELNEEERKVACGNKKGEKSDDSLEAKKKEEVPAKEEKKENIKEQEVVLDESNPHFAFILAPENKTDTVQMALHARAALEQSAAFQWTMKKRLAFDEGCWKHLSRRISAIRAEGFDVRVNTRKARENKISADRETKLDVVFAKLSKPGKKKAAE